jgi:hypothetical protein
MAIMKGEASFTASDGRLFHLVMDLYAFAEAEDVTGLGPQALLKAITPRIDPGTGDVISPPKLKDLGGLLYGALQEKHPGTSLKDAIRLLGDGEAVGEAIAKALDGIMPKADPSAEGKAQAPASGTGTRRKRTGRQKA